MGQHRRDADVEGGRGQHTKVRRDVREGLLQKNRFELRREPLAAVRGRPGNPGVATVEERALQRPVGRQNVGRVVVDRMNPSWSIPRAEVVGQPGPDPEPVRFPLIGVPRCRTVHRPPLTGR